MFRSKKSGLDSSSSLFDVQHPAFNGEALMTFDPLELFSGPEKSRSYKCELLIPLHTDEFESAPKREMNSQKLDTASSREVEYSLSNWIPNEIDGTLHVCDLPLLRSKPKAPVLFLFLGLFAPDQALNFSPLVPHTDPDTIFSQKNVVPYVEDALQWLQIHCPRFKTRSLLASVSYLAETLRKGLMSEYNSWLTQIIASELLWIEPQEAENIRQLGARRLAENCGRTAHPEILRVIEIPYLQNRLQLREPSLTSDNLGLKTWGSSLLLASRLAKFHQQNSYLKSPVLELGSGTGLVGMISHILGHDTTLTDLAEIVPNLRDNVSLNGISACVEELDWLNPDSFVRNHQIKYNTIILSDPLYSPQHPRWIVDMIHLFLANERSAAVLLQLPIRRNFEKERAFLWRLMVENGYVAVEEEREQGHDDFGETEFLFQKYVRSEI